MNETPRTEHDDQRRYVVSPDRWVVQIKHGWEKLFCYAQNPGEDYFHMILHGEIYLQSGDEILCLSCAMRQRVLTADRLHWQRRRASWTDIRPELQEPPEPAS